MTKICKICQVEKEESEFSPYYGEKRKEGKTRNICRKCKNQKQLKNIKSNPERSEKQKEYFKKYYKKHNYIQKVKSYINFDKKHGYETLTLAQFRILYKNHPFCFYCSESDKASLGLDRMDNNKGHNIENVKICCEKCNDILCDIPFSAKVLLKPGLTEIKNKNLLNEWTIRIKRKKKKS